MTRVEAKAVWMQSLWPRIVGHLMSSSMGEYSVYREMIGQNSGWEVYCIEKDPDNSASRDAHHWLRVWLQKVTTTGKMTTFFCVRL